MFSVADVDGNMVENGKFTQTSRGWITPSGWNYVAAQTLPNCRPGRGPDHARPWLEHCDGGTCPHQGNPLRVLRPVRTGVLDQVRPGPRCIDPALPRHLHHPSDTTPLSSLLMTGSSVSGFDWTPKRWYVIGTDAYVWVKPRFVVAGATTTTEIQLWDVNIRRQRTPGDLATPSDLGDRRLVLHRPRAQALFNRALKPLIEDARNSYR